MKYIVTLVLVYLLGAGLNCEAGEAGTALQSPGTERAFFPQGLPGQTAEPSSAVATNRMLTPTTYQSPSRSFDPWAGLRVLLIMVGVAFYLMRQGRNMPKDPPDEET